MRFCLQRVDTEPWHRTSWAESSNFATSIHVTGFYRDGCCNTGAVDYGVHTVCTRVTEEFLTFSASMGNDLSTPHPESAPSTACQPGRSVVSVRTSVARGFRSRHGPTGDSGRHPRVHPRVGRSLSDLRSPQSRPHAHLTRLRNAASTALEQPFRRPGDDGPAVLHHDGTFQQDRIGRNRFQQRGAPPESASPNLP